MECPPARAVPEQPAPLHWIPHVGGRPAAVGSRVRRRPLEVQEHRASVHRGVGRPRGHLRQWRAIMGLLEPGPGPARLQAGPLRSIEAAGGVAPSQWKFDPADWWLEEHGLIMEKPTFPLPPGKYLVTGDRKVTTVLTNSAQGQGRQTAVGTRRRRDPLRCHPSRMPFRTLHAGDG